MYVPLNFKIYLYRIRLKDRLNLFKLVHYFDNLHGEKGLSMSYQF